MRLAIFSDIHGNPIALDAILRNIEAQGGADQYLVLGDYCSHGFDPVSVLERLTALPNVQFICGNTDRYLITNTVPPPARDDVQRDPALLPVALEIAETFAWTRGYLARDGWRTWLAQLPFDLRLMLPDGTRLLAVHATPQDDTTNIHPRSVDDEIRTIISGCNADVLLYGHIHFPLDRRVDDVRLINVGSVSLQTSDDLRASYVFLEADESGYQIEFQRVPYDLDAVIEAIQDADVPNKDYLLPYFQGKFTAWWDEA